MKKVSLILIVLFFLVTCFSVAQASIQTFDSPVDIGEAQAPGVWYKDRAIPSVFESAFFDGDNRLHIGISGDDYPAANPFYNTQGRKYDFGDPIYSVSFGGELYVDAAWESLQIDSVGAWGTGFDGADTVSSYAILAFRNYDSSNSVAIDAGFYGYDYINGGWFEVFVPDTFDFDQWYDLRMIFTATGLEFYVNGNLEGFFADDYEQAYLGNIILNSKNLGESYDVYWDNVGTQAIPVPAAVWLLGSGIVGVLGLRRKLS